MMRWRNNINPNPLHSEAIVDVYTEERRHPLDGCFLRFYKKAIIKTCKKEI